jgi:maltooligosyltrehalose synthase
MKMEEKKEQLRLTKLRWKLLRKLIGENIINTFQRTNLKKEEDEETIELILEEANAYGLRQEVKEWAEKELKEASLKGIWLSKLDAYVTAYHEWIK